MAEEEEEEKKHVKSEERERGERNLQNNSFPSQSVTSSSMFVSILESYSEILQCSVEWLCNILYKIHK
ncbi:hypothetical protein ANTRET_LOCUS4563 [Anthophora retusa]